MRKSLVDTVITRILDRIASGQFPPGTVLPPEDEFAVLFEASRPTCREAVKILCAQKVLRSIHGRGTYVNEVDQWISLEAILRMHDADLVGAMGRLLEVRTLIEIGAIELFAPLQVTEIIDLMEQDIDLMEQGHSETDIQKFVAADIAFHNRILEGCGNPFVAATFIPIASALGDARSQTSAIAQIREHAIAEHQGIVAALRTGKTETAVAAMRSHLEQTRRDALKYLTPAVLPR